MEREQDEQDGPHHQMVQPGELRQPIIGGEPDQRAENEVEIERDVDGARQALQRPVLLGRRRRALGVPESEPPEHQEEHKRADDDVGGSPRRADVGRLPAVRGAEKVRHVVAGEPLVGHQHEHEPVQPDLPHAVAVGDHRLSPHRKASA